MTPQKNNNAKKTPRYSADNMMLRMAGGAALMVLGVLAFLGVALDMEGQVFNGLRQVVSGLSGVLAGVLPVFPVWGGLLLFFSSWRKQHVRALLISMLLFVLAETLVTLSIMTSNGLTNLWLMDHLQFQSPGAAWDDFILRGYDLGIKGMGGGAVSMLLAWPLWKMMGAPLSILLTVLAMAGTGVLLFRVDVKAMLGKAKNAAADRQARQEQEQQRLSQEQLQWQQEQQRRQEQQRLTYQQQMAMRQPQPQPQPMQQRPVMQPVYQPAPVQPQPYRPAVALENKGPAGFRVPGQEHYVQSTVAQLETCMEDYSLDVKEPKKPRKSTKGGIFGKKTEKKHAQLAPDPVPEQPVRQPSDWSRTAPQPVTNTQPVPQPMRTEPVQPVNDWRPAPQPVAHAREEHVPSAAEAPAPKVRRRQQPKPSWEDTPPWEDPAEEVAVPVVQMDTPKNGWKPELKLPPRRVRPQEEEPEDPQQPPYVYPGLDLLNRPQPMNPASQEEDAILSRKLEETLESFKVKAWVRHVTHGPRISRFELELAAGIRVSKLTELDRNIAMNLEVKSVRIEAPIPGTNLVGVEVPNRTVSKVTLREVMESEPILTATTPLTVALGKDIAGKPIAIDLEKMPHLLIAGQTGGGKSVCINSIITSLLYRTSPQQVRMILVDPKVVELQSYNGLPHLLIPVVNDPRKAAGALEWAVAEMNERYQRLASKSVRNINGYNAALEPGEEPMPHIVIIIDELADLMMVCKKDVEERICRIAQLARAAGMHLVVGTQRPSVDVITGLIKANIPSRIAFTTSSYTDSRTIIDRNGAEKLLNYGDMLYLPSGADAPLRVQGCFMEDMEVVRVTDFIRKTCPTEYDPNVLEQLENIQATYDTPEMPAEPEEEAVSDDTLLQKAIEMTVEDGQMSTSMLQRRLRVGYARAGRLVDEMEKRGVVSKQDGAKPRKCLITREAFEQLKATGVLED